MPRLLPTKSPKPNVLRRRRRRKNADRQKKAAMKAARMRLTSASDYEEPSKMLI